MVSLVETVRPYINHYGYWAVFFGVFLESLGLPLPGETLIIVAGLVAAKGILNFTWIVVLAILATFVQIHFRPSWIIVGDLLVGGFTASFIAWSALNHLQLRRPVLVRFLESRIAIFLGDISYSLYLIHFPVIAICSHLIRTAIPATPMLLAILLPSASLPISILLAVVLRRFVERLRMDANQSSRFNLNPC